MHINRETGVVQKTGTKRIVIPDYIESKEEIDEFCRKFSYGYEVYPDGTAVIIVD